MRFRNNKHGMPNHNGKAIKGVKSTGVTSINEDKTRNVDSLAAGFTTVVDLFCTKCQ